LLLVGLALSLWLVQPRNGQGLDSLDLQGSMRQVLWGFTAMALGVQTIYGSFFLSMLRMAQEERN